MSHNLSMPIDYTILISLPLKKWRIYSVDARRKKIRIYHIFVTIVFMANPTILIHVYTRAEHSFIEITETWQSRSKQCRETTFMAGAGKVIQATDTRFYSGRGYLLPGMLVRNRALSKRRTKTLITEKATSWLRLRFLRETQDEARSGDHAAKRHARIPDRMLRRPAGLSHCT